MVAHRSGQLDYPTLWAAHTTNYRKLLVDGACHCESSRQADQALRGEMYHISRVRIRLPVIHSLDEERTDTQAMCERGSSASDTVTRVHRVVCTNLVKALA
jgi:hypothetical protein